MSTGPIPVNFLKIGSSDPGRSGVSCASRSEIPLNIPLLNPRTQVPKRPSRDKSGSRIRTMVRSESEVVVIVVDGLRVADGVTEV